VFLRIDDGKVLVKLFLVSALSVVSSFGLALAQPKTATVTAGERYLRSHGGQDWLLGAGYRELWGTPIEVEMLDLEETAGGLTPVMRIGGLQTLGLALSGADGRAYTFRSVDKGGLLALPEAFADTGLEFIIRDQVSKALPGGALIASGLARSAGILHADAKLVVMPDDARLGEFGETFAGVLGVFFEFPTAGSFGASEVLSDDDFLESLRAGMDRPDSRAFLRARLLDLLIGDWDRHYGQWRWARLPEKERLQPIPEDRDQAFSKYDGLAMAISRAGGGQMTDFAATYPSLAQLAFNGSDHDRLVLNDIARSEWMAIAHDVQLRLDDGAIEDAVSRLPEPYYALRGVELEETLRSRRDRLTEYAEAYYEFLSRQVDVHGSARDERTHITRFDDGAIDVRMTMADADEPHYRRRFERGETRSVRIYLGGGDDRVTVDGSDNGDILIRVIGGADADVIDGPGRHRVRYHQDADGDGYITKLTPEGAKGAFSPMLEANWEIQVPGAPYRDWGQAWQPIFAARWHPDLGMALGGGLDLKRFGFGKLPWAERHRFSGAYAIGSNNAQFEYEGDMRRVGGGAHLETELHASGMEQLRYYGLGNETSREGSSSLFEIGQREYGAAGFLAWGDLRNPLFRAGPVMRFVDSRSTDDESLLGTEAPYGFDTFGQVGARAEFAVDSRADLPTLSTGYEVDATASYYPKLWDVEDDYGTLQGHAAGHLQLSRPMTASLMVRGKKVWGSAFPYFDAAYLGGEEVFSAYNWNRFAGDGMVTGSARLRVALAHVPITVPGDVGLTLRADVGRTFLESEISKRWHSQFTAGVFYAAFDRLLLVEVGVGWSNERTVFTFDADFDWLIR